MSMIKEITGTERAYLRELAKRQLEYSCLPEMEDKKENWMRLNTGRRAVPPVVVETDTFRQDMVPDSMLHCQGKKAREIEYELLKNIRQFELLQDDKVIPGTFRVPYCVEIDEFGIPVEEHHATDAKGRNVGYEYKSPIQDLEEDFELLKPSEVKIDWEKTRKNREFVQEILGDILPVEMVGIPPIIAMPWQVSRLLGLENMMVSMYDCPEAMLRLMDYLTENQIRVMHRYQTEGILTLNNGDHDTCLSSPGFTDRLPQSGQNQVMLKDIWMWAEAEETASISPDMFREFFLPYMAKACQEVGLIYYGCCEPMQLVWQDVIKAIPNIRKVSISPWSDQQQMGEMLRGTDVVFSRKPFANYLGVDTTFDEEAWKCHIAETLQAARGCQCEIIMRDIYQVPDLDSVRRAVKIAKQMAKESMD